MPRQSPLGRWLADALTDRRVVWALTLLYVVVGVFCIATDYTLNDEGLVTVTTADLARHFPLEVLLVQKSKPVLALLYMPFTMFGIRTLLVAHLLVAAAAIPLAAAVARALRFSLPNVPALVIAASPGYLLAGPAGLSNTDGVVGVTLVLYLLLARRRAVAAGLVLGMLPWVRHELVLFAAVLVAHEALVRRNIRFVAASAVFPALYAAVGAFYHHDALWLIHYPPTTMFPMAGNPIWEPVDAGGALVGLLAVSPVALLALAAPWRAMQPVERWLIGYALGWLSLSALMPIWRLANFGFVPRYMLVIVPAVALAAGRSLEAWLEGRPALGRALMATAALAALCYYAGERLTAVALPVLVGCCLALTAAVLHRYAAAAAAVALIVVSGPFLRVPTQIPHAELARYLPEVAAWFREHPAERANVIYTNVPLLAAYLDGAGNVPGLDVRFLLGVDLAWDIENMTSVVSGQREKLPAVLAAGNFNGARGVLPQDLTPQTVADGSLFVFRRDGRLELLMPPQIWSRHLVSIVDDEFRILRFRRDG